MKRVLLGLIFYFQSLNSYSQAADIRGVWYFDRFGGPHSEIAMSADIANANKMDKGMSFTFRNDNKMITKPPGGHTADSTVVKYQVFYDRKEVVLDGVTMKIILLTSDILELYPKDESKPALFLKRSKNGKTSMSAP
jgi:hypothetical protein